MYNADLPTVIPLELSGRVLASSPALTGLERTFTITVLLSPQRKNSWNTFPTVCHAVLIFLLGQRMAEV